MEETKYNGWTNYETWNVALWIGNDAGLYSLAKECKTFKRFKEVLRDIGFEPIASMTLDNVAWNSFRVNEEEIEEMFKEL